MVNGISNNLSTVQILESWSIIEQGMFSLNEILSWIERKNDEINVNVQMISLANTKDWLYDESNGCIRNKTNTFFSIYGIKESENGQLIAQQPIILQPEIGYLGILGKVINGVLHFLMQAKIEPGNVNKIQISPTLQATKSNYLQAHGGSLPRYLEFFAGKEYHEVIVDQIQSEQAGRFYGKRNRNIIVIVKNDVIVPMEDNYRWMTLGQIKELMAYDNLVNMDTRTVIACIPFSLRDYTYKELVHIGYLFRDDNLFRSMFLRSVGEKINDIYHYVNDIKMQNTKQIKLAKLADLTDWYWEGEAFTTSKSAFDVIFCDISIDGREVSHWCQPLLRARKQLMFGLFMTNSAGYTEFLVHCISEIGSFDMVELGPTVQCCIDEIINGDSVYKKFEAKYTSNDGVIFSRLFSEEGGRFYHEQNRNVLILIDKDEIPSLPQGYFWVDYQTLNILIQFNNCLNIQLRNLLSLLKL